MPIGHRVGEHRCAVCSKANDLEHVLFDCPAAVAFWQLVLKAWASVTTEQSWTDAFFRDAIMDQECLRAVALGLRPPGAEANEDQWHTLRALAMVYSIRYPGHGGG